jgi:hypothetical protein
MRRRQLMKLVRTLGDEIEERVRDRVADLLEQGDNK